MIDLKEQSPLALAFLGDAVYSLVIKQHLVENKRCAISKLNRMSVEYVSANGQYRALNLIRNLLTEEEALYVKRGRNSSKATVAKHARPRRYRASTGLECLFGYLKITGQDDRIERLVKYIMEKIPLDEKPAES